MSMLKAFVRRVLILAATIVAGGLLSATLARYAPGFGSDERQLDVRLSSESIRAIQGTANAEKRITSYYLGSLHRMMGGDLGTSRLLQRPVLDLLLERGAVTLRIVAAGLGTAWLAAVAIIVTCWLARSPIVERVCTVGIGSLLCLPAGVVALLLVMMNAPGFIAIGLAVCPKVHRYLSDLLRATTKMPHVVAAKAKGIGEARILVWHVVPVIRREAMALVGVSLGLAVSAAIPVEVLSGIPGAGQLAWQSAMARDLPVLIHISLAVVAITVLANTGADLMAEDRGQPS